MIFCWWVFIPVSMFFLVSIFSMLFSAFLFPFFERARAISNEVFRLFILFLRFLCAFVQLFPLVFQFFPGFSIHVFFHVFS